MNNDPASLDEKITSLSRGLFINRCLLAFIAICVGIMLFLPRLAALVAETSQNAIDGISPFVSGILGAVLAINVVILVGAYLVAKISPGIGALKNQPKKG